MTNDNYLLVPGNDHRDLTIMITPSTPPPNTDLVRSHPLDGSPNSGRRNTMDGFLVQTRRASMFSRRPSTNKPINKIPVLDYLQNMVSSRLSVNCNNEIPTFTPAGHDIRLKNRRRGQDALSAALSALYAKFMVVLGIALPVTNVLSYNGSASFYQGFYLYLYIVSMAYIVFMYLAHLKTLALSQILKMNPNNDRESLTGKTEPLRYGSFYLRVGTVAFGIGSMVYSGLEFGQYFELKNDPDCQNILIALTPAARMALTILQIQFVFLNSKEVQIAKHPILSRFGLMHMVATNLCEWLYTLIEETKHEIIHFTHKNHLEESASTIVQNMTNLAQELVQNHTIVKRATGTQVMSQCKRSNIMGSLVQNASQFLFPCTIEYSLICAVILFEMWKKIKSLEKIERSRRNSKKTVASAKNAHHLSVDCSEAHRGMFAGVLVIVITIISLIMYFVLVEVKAYRDVAIMETTITEMMLHIITILALCFALLKMRDLKYLQSTGERGMPLDCTLLVLAQSGIYIYCTFSIIGHYFSLHTYGAKEGLVADVIALLQTSIQTLFILNAWSRRCKGSLQNRLKPGRQIVTFLLVTNMAMWFTNTLVKSQASFRPTHIQFFGLWAWTVITHVSMPLAIFYRFHSTICLFEIWKTVYKMK